MEATKVTVRRPEKTPVSVALVWLTRCLMSAALVATFSGRLPSTLQPLSVFPVSWCGNSNTNGHEHSCMECKCTLHCVLPAFYWQQATTMLVYTLGGEGGLGRANRLYIRTWTCTLLQTTTRDAVVS